MITRLRESRFLGVDRIPQSNGGPPLSGGVAKQAPPICVTMSNFVVLRQTVYTNRKEPQNWGAVGPRTLWVWGLG